MSNEAARKKNADKLKNQREERNIELDICVNILLVLKAGYV